MNTKHENKIKFLEALDNHGLVSALHYRHNETFRLMLEAGSLEKVGSVDDSLGPWYTLKDNPYKLRRSEIANDMVKTVEIPGFNNSLSALSSDNINAILAHASTLFELDVAYCDEFVDSEGTVTKHPELAWWSMSWVYGTIGFCALGRSDQEAEGRAAAAIFVWLWKYKGVEANVAERLAEAYVLTHKYK